MFANSLIMVVRRAYVIVAYLSLRLRKPRPSLVASTCIKRLLMAAAYPFHIVSNQLFVDGNKRTGLLATLVFLEINNISIAG